MRYLIQIEKRGDPLSEQWGVPSLENGEMRGNSEGEGDGDERAGREPGKHGALEIQSRTCLKEQGEINSQVLGGQVK